MNRIGYRSALVVGMLFGAVIGCRTPQPDLKPPKEPEVISPPPSLTQYDSPYYPKQCFEDRGVPKKMMQASQPLNAGGTPAMGMGGMNGMGR